MLADAALSPARLSALAHCLSLEADLMSQDGEIALAGQLRDRARQLQHVAVRLADDG